jgi:hypothetical protein
MFFGCLMRQPHQTPHKNRIIPIFCAVSDAAVASDTVKITVRVNTPLIANLMCQVIGIYKLKYFNKLNLKNQESVTTYVLRHTLKFTLSMKEEEDLLGVGVNRAHEIL